MARLRLRIELDRPGQGLPVEALADFCAAVNLLFVSLSSELGLSATTGEWRATRFRSPGFGFTAEFSGPAEPHHAEALQARLRGREPLALSVVAHLAGIGHTIGEDQTVGIGLFARDNDEDPADWLTMSRSRAVSVWQQINRTESGQLPSHVLLEMLQPAGDKRRYTPTPAPQPELEVRVDALEEKVAAIELNLKKMVGHVDEFCASVGARLGVDGPAIQPALFGQPESSKSPSRLWIWIAAVILLATCVLIFTSLFKEEQPLLTGHRPEPAPVKTEPPKPEPVKPAPPQPEPAKPEPADDVEKASPLETAASDPIVVKLEATGPSWISVFENGEKKISRLLDTGQQIDLRATQELRVRLGNAGNVQFTWNGKPMGPGGPSGHTRMLRFTRTDYENLVVRLPIRD